MLDIVNYFKNKKILKVEKSFIYEDYNNSTHIDKDQLLDGRLNIFIDDSTFILIEINSEQSCLDFKVNKKIYLSKISIKKDISFNDFWINRLNLRIIKVSTFCFNNKVIGFELIFKNFEKAIFFYDEFDDSLILLDKFEIPNYIEVR